MELMLQDLAGEVRIASLGDDCHELESHVWSMMGMVGGDLISQPVPEDTQRNPHENVVAVVRTADVVSIHPADRLLAHQCRWII
jgi:hypothetical protein